MRRWTILVRAMGISFLLMCLRFGIDYLKLDILPETNLIGCFVGGTLFVLALMLAGVMADFKESEKIADDLPTTILDLFHYSKYIELADSSAIDDMQSHIKALLSELNNSLKRKQQWDTEGWHKFVYAIVSDIKVLSQQGVNPQFIASMQTDLSNVMKMINRIDTIKGTLFLPAGYVASYITVIISILMLLFIQIESSYYQGFVMVGAISMVLVFIILLIHDMDDPFEASGSTFADVDLSHLFDLEKHLS